MTPKKRKLNIFSASQLEGNNKLKRFYKTPASSSPTSTIIHLNMTANLLRLMVINFSFR